MDVFYLLENIFGPILITVFFIGLGFWAGMGSVVIAVEVVIVIGCILWWIFGPEQIFQDKRRQYLKEIDSSDFVRSRTYNAGNITLAADLENGKIAMIFKWNPKQYYVLPANHITDLWVDESKTVEGSCMRSFLLIVDGVKIRVNTVDVMMENLRKACAAANGETDFQPNINHA